MPTEEQKEQQARELLLFTGKSFKIDATLITEYKDAWWCAVDQNGHVKSDDRITSAKGGDVVGLCIDLKVPKDGEKLLKGTEIAVTVVDSDFGPLNDDETGYVIAKVTEGTRATAKIKLYRNNKSRGSVFELNIFRAFDNNTDKKYLDFYVKLPEWGRKKIGNKVTAVKMKGDREFPANDKNYLQVMSPRFVDGWFVHLIAGNYKSRGVSSATINNTSQSTKSKAVSETDYGKSVRIVVKTKNIPNESKVEIELYYAENNKLLRQKLIGTVTDNLVIVPVYLDPEWYRKESDTNNTIYFIIRAEGDKKIETRFPVEESNYLKVWQQPFLHINCDNYVTSFYPGSARRSLPSNWNNEPESDKRYWPRLGRAYSGLGIRGHEIISWEYKRRGKVKRKTFTVSNINWRGNAGSSGNQNDFEHPSPNKEDSVVRYINQSATFQFSVSHHEDSVWIHKGRNIEGCIALGSGTDCNELWDLLHEVLNPNKSEFENGKVTVTNETVQDSVTNLDYDYRNIFRTGLDICSANQKLTDEERREINMTRGPNAPNN